MAWTPVKFRALDQLNGGAGTGSNEVLLGYQVADARRWADAYGIPFVYNHRRNPADQTAHKVHLLAQDAGKEWEARWLGECYGAIRVHGLDYTIPEVTLDLARKVGIPGLDRLDDPNLDARLDANTRQAHKDGACGVPFLRWKGQAYWGNDRLAWLEAHLAGRPHPDV